MTGLAVLRGLIAGLAVAVLVGIVATWVSDRFDAWVRMRVGWLRIAVVGAALLVVDLVVRLTVGWP